MENRYRINQNPESETQEMEEGRNDAQKEVKKPGIWATIFSDDFLPKDKALALFPYFLFLALLGVLYIANRYKAEGKVRKWTEGVKEVQELKWEYITLQSKWMMATKQSQLAVSAQSLGLKESITPPFIIELEK